MDFKSIPAEEIVSFLNANNLYNLTNIYHQALTLINNNNFQFTPYMKCWLLAYQHQNTTIKTQQSLKYYHDLFEMPVALDEVATILSYFHFPLNQLPDEIVIHLLLYLTTELKSVNKSLHAQYKRITQTHYFQQTIVQKLLYHNHYDTAMYDTTNIKNIYKILQPRGGNVIMVNQNTDKPLNFPEPIVKIRIFKYITFFISQKGRVYAQFHNKSDWEMTNIIIPVTDIVFNHKRGYVILSRGSVYFYDITTTNRYTYDARLPASCSFIYRRIDIDNVLSISATRDTLMMLKTNGEVYTFNDLMDQVELKLNGIKSMACTKDIEIYRNDDVPITECYRCCLMYFPPNVQIVLGRNSIFIKNENLKKGYSVGKFHLLLDDQHNLWEFEQSFHLKRQNVMDVAIKPKDGYFIIV